MEYEEDALVLAIVEKIENMNVFVKLPDGRSGTIVTSEIAPGRIKNLREYVAPNKIIVCKILRVLANHLELSLRRVSNKEKQEVMMRYVREKDLEKGLKAILKEKCGAFEQKMKQDFGELFAFFEEAKKNEKILKEYFPSELLESIKKLIDREKKEVEVKKIVRLKCLDSNGLHKIQEILRTNNEKIKIIYISAGNYLIVIKAEEYKKANQEMQGFLDNVEKKVKKCTCEYSVEENKQR